MSNPNPDWEVTMHELATSPAARVSIPRSQHYKRKQVEEAFIDAFQLIGGVPRLAVWADENPTEFYRLYSKLLPKEQARHDDEMKIIHVLPQGALD